MTQIEVKNLTLGFDHKPLLTNLSFKIKGPSFIAILGHNGCGKTTFLKSLIGQHTFRGEIFLNEQNISQITNITSTGLITLLEQKNQVNFSIQVKELVVMGRFQKKSFFENYDQKDYDEVNKVLKFLGISELAEKDYQNLSGGEQQLVWLAQVILQDSEIILLDEPTQQLDVYNKKLIFSLLEKLVKENNKTVLCVTHDVGNLSGLDGWILNLSSKELLLERIGEESLRRSMEILEVRSTKEEI